jgi:hypothetical protein
MENQLVRESIIDSMTLESVRETLKKINAFHAIVKASLIADIDYGVIPGTSKPILYKSGAETILMLFGLTTTIEILSAVPKELAINTDFVSYVVKCKLLKNNATVSEGVGTCNSSERKYQKAEALDIANTIMKMACKRALVDAVLHVASLSAVFAHEIDDIKDYRNKEIMDNFSVDDASAYKVTFGKHKGKTCGEIYKQHFDYVQWYSENGNDEAVRKAFKVLNEAIRSRTEKAKKTEKEKEKEAEPEQKELSDWAERYVDVEG